MSFLGVMMRKRPLLKSIFSGLGGILRLRSIYVAAAVLAGTLARGFPASVNDAVAQATASLQQAIPRAQADPNRPVFHFRAPAQWMNDPNGLIYHRGFYHLFYQLNPYDDEWGRIHWGHARSRDMVRWQHLPIALWPSRALGEEHVFSGCAVINPREQPMLFYTSIAQGKPPETHAEQWAALGDQDLVRWEKHPGNPILTEALHGGKKVFDWRDPFIFQHQRTTYMILGGNLNKRQGGQAVVNLYRAENGLLTRWTHLGVLFTHPSPQVVNIECPNLFRFGRRWVLVVSPHGRPEYFIGSFNPRPGGFVPEESGVLDFGDSFYAPNSLGDPRGRRVMWGWIKGFEAGQGWNGCLTLPRVLSLDPEFGLQQEPAPELKKLREDHFRLSDFTLSGGVREITGLHGDCLEIYAEIELLRATAVHLQVRRSSDGARFIPITFDGAILSVAGIQAPLRLAPGEYTLKLRLFLDKSVLEVFANNRACVTQVIESKADDLGVALEATGGAARIRSFHMWKMRPIW